MLHVSARFFDYYILLALGCFFLLVALHAGFMCFRGVEIQGRNRQLSRWEKIQDGAGDICPLIRYYETIAYALPLGFHFPPPFLGKVLVSSILIKAAGTIMWAIALVLYASAHWVFGTSWRLRTGSQTPGKLVTGGVFRYSRNPIYVSFMLMTIGTFCVLGQFIFLLLALISIPLLHARILREERFLADTHGPAYSDYCRRVPRYGGWWSR